MTMKHTNPTPNLPNSTDPLALGYHKRTEFERQMESHLNAMADLIETQLAEAGDTCEDSQKVAMRVALSNFHAVLNGVSDDDMAASEAELCAQLNFFCTENNLAQRCAYELLAETSLSYTQRQWLEHFSRRWENQF